MEPSNVVEGNEGDVFEASPAIVQPPVTEETPTSRPRVRRNSRQDSASSRRSSVGSDIAEGSVRGSTQEPAATPTLETTEQAAMDETIVQAEATEKPVVEDPAVEEPMPIGDIEATPEALNLAEEVSNPPEDIAAAAMPEAMSPFVQQEVAETQPIEAQMIEAVSGVPLTEDVESAAPTQAKAKAKAKPRAKGRGRAAKRTASPQGETTESKRPKRQSSQGLAALIAQEEELAD